MLFGNKDRIRMSDLKRLSAKAYQVYAQADPLEIYCKDGTYYLRGMFEADDMTFDEMEQFFSNIADALGYKF